MTHRRKLACFDGGPVFVARYACKHCNGNASLRTPEMDAWEAGVDQLARALQGPVPETTAEDCPACEGTGVEEKELTLDALRDLLLPSDSEQ